MLQFFRKHQRYFFIVLTIIIIVSFSFFGTYTSLNVNDKPDPAAFTAINGKEIKRSHLDAFIRFIATDNMDKLLNGGQWGPNFLNDGVVRKDFLETNLGLLVAKPFFPLLKEDLDSRFQVEKNYKPYVHPSASFVSAESVWNYLAPEISKNMQVIQKNEPVLSEENLAAKIRLYLEEKKFPAQYLRQVLRYQESQYNWIASDPSLYNKDLNLFGHATLEEWFGPKFLELVSEFIINGSFIAENNGVVISDSDALADLLYNNEVSFRQMQKANSTQLGVRSSQEYFQEQLRILGMDQAMAVSVWKQIMLFRQLSSKGASTVFIDPLVYEQYKRYVGESVDAVVYQLPTELRFSKEKDLQKYDTYITKVAKKVGPLDVPAAYRSLEEIMKDVPELVQKQYVLKYSEVKVKDLQLNVPLKQAWGYELEAKNWPKLIIRFPELGTKLDLTEEMRFAQIEKLDSKRRAMLDTYAKEMIVKEHPEWIDEALDNAEVKEKVITIRNKGSEPPLEGIKNIKEFQDLLDKSPLIAGDDFSDLARYSQDEETFYAIHVVKRDDEARVVTFTEAIRDKLLDRMLDKRLEVAYKKMQEENPELFLDDAGKAKTFAAVKEDVAAKLFAPLYDQIITYAENKGYPWHENTGVARGDFAAEHRFLKYVNTIKEEILLGDERVASLQDTAALESAFLERQEDRLQEQFKIEKASLTIDRSSAERFDPIVFLAVDQGNYSSVNFLPKEGPYFFYVSSKGYADKDIASLMQKGQKILHNESVTLYMQECLDKMMDNKSIALVSLPSMNVDGISG